MEVKDISICRVAEVCPWNSNRSPHRTTSKNSWMQDIGCSVCYGCGSQFNIFNCCCDCHVCEDTSGGDYSQKKLNTNGCSWFQTRDFLHLFKIFCSQGDKDIAYFTVGKISQKADLFSSAVRLSSISPTDCVLKGLLEYPQLGSTGFHFHCGVVMDHELEQEKVLPGRMNSRILSLKGGEGSPSPYDFCNESRSDEDDECLREAVSYHPRYPKRLENNAGEDSRVHLEAPASDGTKINPENSEVASQCFDQQSELSAGSFEEPEEGLEENNFYASVYSEPLTSKEKDLPLDIENNALLWAAPPPESDEDEFGSSEEEDEDDAECWSLYSSVGSSSSSKCRSKESSLFELRKDIRAVVNGHFRLVVGQLLNREGLLAVEGGPESWLEIVVSLALEAANVVKPDTSIGGRMDPGAYIKVNCVASGRPTESQVVRGIVCKKNVAHKRMTSRFKAPRLLLLGGSLDLHSVSNHLSSLDTLLQQERDHLSLVVSRIDAHHPNVLLVEKTVSRQAQERLLAKGISVVLNIKRSLLERIGRCTGATIVSNLEHLASAKVGHCELFCVEKYSEEHGSAGQGGKKSTKTLMFFKDCPKPFGCSILLKGANANELKKVKRAVKLAVYAAYHLALETSFLADEGVELCLTSSLSAALPAKSKFSLSPAPGLLPSTSLPAKNQAQNHPLSLESPPISSKVSDLTTDHGPLISTEASPERSVSQMGMSPFTSPLSSPSKAGGDSSGGDSVKPGTASKTLGLQEVIGATLGKLSAAMALEDLGQGVLNFTASVRDALSAEMASEPSPTTNIKQFDDDELASMEKITNVPAAEDLQNQLVSVPSERKDSNSPTFEDHSTFQTSNGDCDAEELSREEFPPSPSNHQSILVSFSSSCLRKGTICERGHLFRIKYYGTFDKPLGRFLRETLFDLTQKCPACGESKDAHVDCYTHRQGCLTISVHKQSQSLSGESEGKIWMWHRCLRCNRVDGLPPATRRLVMSDPAWGLSFGKFLELSFSNHAAASRIASCGHSLHRDCLRFYGFGNMTACMRYSPVNVYSVCLPPSKLDFHCIEHQEWLEQEIREVAEKGDHIFKDIFSRLQHVYDKITNVDGRSQEAKSHILELKDILTKQKDSFKRALHDAASCRGTEQPHADILQLNYIRRSLLKCSSLWDNRIQSLSSSLKSPRSFPGFDSTLIGDSILSFLKEISFGSGRNRKPDASKEPSVAGSPNSEGIKLNPGKRSGQFLLENSKPTGLGTAEDACIKEAEAADAVTEVPCTAKSVDLVSSAKGSSTSPRSSGFDGCHSESIKKDLGMGDRPYLSGNTWPSNMKNVMNSANVLEDHIGVHRSLSEGHFSVFKDVSATFDAVWTGEGQTQDDIQLIGKEAGTSETTAVSGSFLNEWSKQASSETSDEGHLEILTGNLYPTSTLTSPAKAGQPSNIEGWVGAPYLSFSRRYNDENMSLPYSPEKAAPVLSGASFTEQVGTQEGVVVSLSPGIDEPVVSVYDDEPTSVIAYAITSQEHQLHVFEKSDKQRDKEKDWEKSSHVSSGGGSHHPFQSSEGRSDKGISNEGSGSSSYDSLLDSSLLDSKACHVKVDFTDDTPQGKIKYAVTCYYAKQFDFLRKRCCRNELDFIRSLCRCKKWGAQGGKSNVFFAKTADDRFVVKQVTRTELDSFLTFAPAYFKHIFDALITGSPTCLAKILGIYQVTVKHTKGGKELRMDLMIMENLLYGRRVTRVYDLKGSLRSRYNADANAKDAVLLDQNLLESVQSNPIFISNKAKRLLERAVWNDTAFLASVDVMDYSLLVGVDEEKGDLVLGIIDFMRQYTWDKHLETWVKTSGILGGPKNAAPTVISPKQYKIRFRKAMSTYFLMVPDQWLPHSVISSLPYHDDIDDNFLATLGDRSSFDHEKGRV